MKEQDKLVLVRIFSERIIKDGGIRLSALKSVLTQENISTEILPKNGLKNWISDNFPEFVISGTNGFETLKFLDDKTAKAWVIIETALQREGKILLSAIPGILSNHPEGFNYKVLAKEKKLGEWIESTFPDFVISEDNLWLMPLVKNQSAFETDILADTRADNNENNAFQEIHQMHSMAYMNWWAVNAKRLKLLNDSITEEQARRTIACAIGRLILGDRKNLIYAMDEETPRIAFDTGLRAKNAGEVIYCILVPNPKNEDGSKQIFAQDGFDYALSGSELGQWIFEHVGKEKKQVDYSVLENKAELVSDEMKAVHTILEEYILTLDEGKLPAKNISDLIAEYEKECNDLREIFTQTWNKPYPEESTIEQIIYTANVKNVIFTKALESIHALHDIIEKTHELFVQNRLAGENSAALEDLKVIDERYASINETTDFSEVYEIIKIPKLQ